MKISLTLLTLVLPFMYFSQSTICLGLDTTVCANQPVTIIDCGNVGGTVGNPNAAAYVISTIPYTPDPMNLGTLVPLTDDSQSGMITIPFSFCFYGNTYTQLIIGANNFVTFSAGGSSTWVTTPIPNTGAVPKNCIMGPWQDINPGAGGTVRYASYGVAPFRRFSVSWSNVPMFGCTGQLYSSQIIIYETTNVIETHILNKAICGTWNGGKAVHGLHNIGGTAAVIVPGRNDTQWATANEGRRFTPGALGIQWGNTLGASFPYNGGSLTVTNVPSGTTGYFLKSACAGNGSVSDTTFITRSVSTVAAVSISDTCGAGNGVMTATPGLNGPYTYTWTNIPQTTAVVNNVVAGNYTVTATNVHGCVSTAPVIVPNQISSSSGSSTLVTCPGGTDGTATASMLPATTSVTYLWDDPAAQTTQIAVGLAAGTYTCTITGSNGCVEIVTVVVSEIPGTIATISNLQHVTCYTGNDGIISLNVSSGTSPYTYVWSGSSSTTSSANDLYVGAQQVDIIDSNGCLVTIDTTLFEPLPLSIDSVSTDSMICSESSIMLGVVGSGGSSPYIYTWLENGNLVSSNQYPTVDPLNTGTVYEITLSEQCGSPTTSETLTITFPTPIQPLVVSDPNQACAPETFKFINTSSNNTEIASTFYLFSNGAQLTMNGIYTASLLFQTAGIYDVDMTITSIYGCVYNDNFPGIITALQRPKALFSFSSNPTTIFETRIKMLDKSTDAVGWQWIATGATPGAATSQNPEFFFPQTEGLYPVNLTVTSPLGCWDTVTYILNVQSDVLFYAPNTFTPDNDEHNPTWKLSTAGMDLSNFELTVYNRWGEVMWQTLDTTGEWDGTFNGTQVATGMYNWKAKYKKYGKEDFKTATGSVTVLR